MSVQSHSDDVIVSDSALVAKAVMRAADRLGLTHKVLARVIGVSEASVTRMRRGDFPLERSQKPFELAILFIRLYRSLDAIVGGDDAAAGKWLTAPNVALGKAPLDLIQTVSGLSHVIQYLDARRAVV